MYSLEQFKKMVQHHDLTYAYSDDNRVWRAGEASLKAIKEAAKQFPKEVVVKIWNDMVDSKIIEGYREECYWKDYKPE